MFPCILRSGPGAGQSHNQRRWHLKRRSFPIDSRARWLRLQVDALEPRRLLDGNVNAVVQAGNLMITGDSLGNGIVIDSKFLEAGEYRVSPRTSATTVNGGGSPVVLTGITKDVKIQMNDGDDVVELDGVFWRDLIVDGGDGNNTIVDDVIGHVQVNRNFIVKNGAGFDTFDVNTSYVFGDFKMNNGEGNSLTRFPQGGIFRKNFNIRNGAGTDVLEFTGAFADRVEGNASINNGDGDTETTIQAIRFQKNLTIVNGAGEDTLSLSGEGVDRNLKISNGDGDGSTSIAGMEIGNNLLCTGGTGFDKVTLSLTDVYGNTKIVNDVGVSQTNVWLSETGKGLQILNRSGFDNVHIVSSASAGTAKITSRDAGSLISITKSGFNRGLIQTEAGADEVRLVEVWVRTMRIDTGEGADTVRIDESGFLGSFRCNVGAGTDDVHIERNAKPLTTRFYANASFILGSGDDSIFVGVAADPWRCAIFDARLQLNGGADWDTADLYGNGNTFAITPNPVQMEVVV